MATELKGVEFPASVLALARASQTKGRCESDPTRGRKSITAGTLLTRFESASIVATAPQKAAAVRSRQLALLLSTEIKR